MKLLFSLLLLGICVLSAFAQMPKIEPGVSHDLAVWRAAHYSDVGYKLSLTLEKMLPVLKGNIEIRVNVASIKTAVPGVSTQPVQFGTCPVPIILDWRKIVGHEKDSTLSNVTINGIAVSEVDISNPILSDGEPRMYNSGLEHLLFHTGVKVGENVIKLDFTSPILTSGSAITRYIDKEDGSEYIYSILSPSNASTVFPMFNQPDLKASFELDVTAPRDWTAISNGRKWAVNHHVSFQPTSYTISHSFNETKPISSNSFAFAAGPFEGFEERPRKEVIDEILTEKGGLIETDYSNPKYVTEAEIRSRTINIYVRESQWDRFKRHATEIFKQARNGNKYFDHKSAWPKYDLVLIPYLTSEMVQAAGITFVRESTIICDK